MLPASLTATNTLSQAATVVGNFDGLIVLVVGLSIGFAVVGWIIGKARNAM